MRIFLFLLVLALVFPVRGADSASGEIERLIRFVGSSNVRFIRNGTEYSAPEGADHLRDKLSKAGNRVKTAEDFIEGIASKSYLSGKPYLVKFPDGHTEPTNSWLKKQLTADRQQHPQ